MPIIVVEMWDGRTVEQKKILVDGIVSTFGKIGVPAEAVHIVIHESPKQNWATGGVLCSEIKPK